MHVFVLSGNSFLIYIIIVTIHLRAFFVPIHSFPYTQEQSGSFAWLRSIRQQVSTRFVLLFLWQNCTFFDTVKPKGCFFGPISCISVGKLSLRS